jgi:hypothetical protein
MPIIPAPERLRQEGHEFKAAWAAYGETVSKPKEKKLFDSLCFWWLSVDL